LDNELQLTNGIPVSM